MKFNYSKLMMLLYYLFLFVFCFSFYFLFVFASGEFELFTQNIEFVFMIYFAAIFLDYKNRANRNITFFDNYIHFNSINIRFQGKPVTLNVKYEDIYKIDAKRFPVIGIWLIEISADKFGHKIPVSYCFTKYEEVYSIIYQRVKTANPQVKIDEKLTEFLVRRNKI